MDCWGVRTRVNSLFFKLVQAPVVLVENSLVRRDQAGRRWAFAVPALLEPRPQSGYLGAYLTLVCCFQFGHAALPI